MKQDQKKQLEVCEDSNSDWTVIQSRRQQREERQQDGKGSHAPSCQQSRAKKKSRRPRRQRRLNKLDAYIRTTSTPEEWADYKEGNSLRTSGLVRRPAPLRQRPHAMPLLPIHALVPYCPNKPARRPQRQRQNRDLRSYPCSRRQAKVKPSGRGKEFANNFSYLPFSQREVDEAWIEHLDSIQGDDDGRRRYVKPSPSPRKPNAKPGVADKFFRSQQKWSKFYNCGKVIGCASGKPPSGGTTGAPQSP